jgi:hypothetical protein
VRPIAIRANRIGDSFVYLVAIPVAFTEIHMKIAVVSAAVLLVGLAQVVVAVPAGKERAKDLAALEEKMLGDWKGQTGCAGDFFFRADGTYELKRHGPAGHDLAGTWKIRWDALPPTLVLTCKSSDVDEEVGVTREVKLVQLDDKNLAIDRAKESVSLYARVNK